VFLDIWLQGSKLDGLQLLEQIKKDHAEVPVVMISGTAISRPRSRPSSAALTISSKSPSSPTG